MIENRNGSVNVTLPSGTGFVAQADTTDGDLEDEFSIPVQGEDTRKSLQGTVGQGGPTVRISTTQGDISLKQGNAAPLPPAPPSSPKLTLAPDLDKQIRDQTAQALQQAATQLQKADAQAKAARKQADAAVREQKGGEDGKKDKDED